MAPVGCSLGLTRPNPPSCKSTAKSNLLDRVSFHQEASPAGAIFLGHWEEAGPRLALACLPSSPAYPYFPDLPTVPFCFTLLFHKAFWCVCVCVVFSRQDFSV